MLNKYIKIDGIPDLIESFLNEGKVFEIKKDDFFFRKDEVSKLAGFIKKGAFRFIDYTNAGKTQILGYGFQNEFVADYGAFQAQIKPLYHTQAITDSIVYALTREKFNQICANHKNLHLRSQIAESLLVETAQRLVSLYHTSEERYKLFTENHPDLLNIISLKEVASFIGVTPETISRIRKNIKI